MKFYTYRQNNSGGSFVVSSAAGVGQFVIIEASSHNDADSRAEEIGLYFNGCDNGLDCPCCGDRWSRQWGEDDAYDFPAAYGSPIEEYKPVWDSQAFIHYADGSIKMVELSAD